MVSRGPDCRQGCRYLHGRLRRPPGLDQLPGRRAVAPSYQRHGLATQLVREAERLLRAAGCPKINLQIRTSNTGVIDFYKTLDFAVDDVVSLGKRLESDRS
jgi:GNAT superfamily N-acetyltransferase